jgi:hypothetical protein
MPTFKSKKELDEEQKFPLLPQDDYELIVVKMTHAVRDKYMAKPDKEGKIPSEEIANVILEVVACKDGSSPQDEEGENAAGRKVFFTIRKDSMGFMRDGTPSKTRCFIAFATGQDVLEEINLENWEDLIGKTIYAEIVQYQNQKGQTRNKISRILPPPKKEKRKVDIKEEDIPIID